ncbi:hypothetical protein L1987_63875 [Smallanthus sonchifolius]|uniref:Uncharacterized protein n=1 Tax=Smallanthus sonchifolius TaxID=185202 RepID=A0ACB9CEE4_9ASTR|nr:hypothetical protein L1987_63875 [Smallanthus sonchifolius]
MPPSPSSRNRLPLTDDDFDALSSPSSSSSLRPIYPSSPSSSSSLKTIYTTRAALPFNSNLKAMKMVYPYTDTKTWSEKMMFTIFRQWQLDEAS